jgi:hypothetical protein
MSKSFNSSAMLEIRGSKNKINCFFIVKFVCNKLLCYFIIWNYIIHQILHI